MRNVTAILLAGLLGTLTPAQTEPSVDVFARIGAPGMPEGIIVRDGLAYVGTHTSIRGNSGGEPSKIFVYQIVDGTSPGVLIDTITIEGQALNATHGILAMAFDSDGSLFVVDRNPPRIIEIDVQTHVQSTYATFPDLPRCLDAAEDIECSPTTLDQAAFPDYLAFAPDGSMYVTDLEAATIFRVPPGGGGSSVWYQDARFDGVFGLNGIAVSPDGQHLDFAMTGSQQPDTPGQAIIYRLPITPEPEPDDLETLFVYDIPASGADGIRYGASGLLYVALAGSNQVSILDPATGEETRFPDAASNQLQEVPFDLPASIDLDGYGNLLVTNQSFFTANSENWAVLRVPIGDIGLPLIEP